MNIRTVVRAARAARVSLAAAAAVGIAAAALAQPRAGGPFARPAGYLGAEGVPDHTVFLAPPPAPDSPLGVADLEIYRATRSLEGSERWTMAAADNEIRQGTIFADFGCALGLALDPEALPATRRLIGRASADLGPIVGSAKALYARDRPFIVEQGPTCIEPSPGLAASGSYPSGHAATGWLYALLLAEAAPEHTDALLARGRAYGESRVVCGVHFVSDVDAGRATATALVTALHGNAEYAADVAAARAEIAALRADGEAPAAAKCAAESSALARPW